MPSFLKSIGHFFAHDVLPQAVKTLFHHPSINSLKFGSLCVLSGAAALVQSSILKIAKNRFLGANPNTPPLTRGRIIQAACGSLLVAYGLYQICESFFVWQPPDVTLSKVVRRVKDCPQTGSLWNQAHANGRIFLVFGHQRTGGMWDERNRTIILDPQLSENNMLATLVFELCNAKRQKASDFYTVWQKCEDGDVGRMEFVKKKMQWESPSLMCHHQAVVPCLISQGWDQEIDRYLDQLTKYPTFEVFWKVYQHDPDHAEHREHLIDLWNKYFRKPFCSRHPASLECVAN
ncbi:MAG: hypothetical protein LLG04_17815 [Parachlamydia sp.]|nr:hypothetical protein [Parachlamydia sp.]